MSKTNDSKSKRIYSFLSDLPPGCIALKVKGQDGRAVNFQVKLDTKLDGVLKKYCERQQLDYRTMQFFYNGNRVHGPETPQQLAMEHSDTIDAMTHVDGGGPFILKSA